MEEKKYLKWYNKVGYGSGDIAGNVVFAFLSSFIMIYLTNTVGLNAGVIGSLIAASKVLDGISDVVFGSMIDRTHTKMGNALVAECSEHTFLQYGKRIDGTMYSCTSMGLKVGSGLGTAIVGWLLNFGGFNGQLKVQSQSCINMLHFMYLWLPMIINILVALLLTQLNVEKANEKLRIQKEIGITK